MLATNNNGNFLIRKYINEKLFLHSSGIFYPFDSLMIDSNLYSCRCAATGNNQPSFKCMHTIHLLYFIIIIWNVSLSQCYFTNDFSLLFGFRYISIQVHTFQAYFLTLIVEFSVFSNLYFELMHEVAKQNGIQYNDKTSAVGK